MADTIRRTVTITEGRASCTIVEADDGAVIVRASYSDSAEIPHGNLSLHVSAPDRHSARLWCASMIAALRGVIERSGG